MPRHGELNPQVFPMTISDVSRRADELAKIENAAWKKWWDIDKPERRAVLDAVFDAMLVMLEDPHWVPPTLKWQEGGRIDVTFSVFMQSRRVDPKQAEEQLVALLRRLRERNGTAAG